MPARSCLMVLADGARPDIFERLLAAGELPNIQRHVVDRGAYRRATSTFTSTTGPAHLPFLTGCFAGTVDVPGYRWFDRRSYRRGLPFGPWCLRSYNGPEAWLYPRDMKPGIATLYEIANEAINVFGVVTRGVPKGNSLFARTKNLVWLYAHYAHDYVIADKLAARALGTALERDSEFRFVVFPAIDWQSHYVDGEGEGALASYRYVDRAVGRAAAVLQRKGEYDSTLIVVCSDHGHWPVQTHRDIAVALEEDHGLRVAYHSKPALRRDVDAVSCVSGNGMAHVYLKGATWKEPTTRTEIDRRYPGVRQRLLDDPAIDVMITRDDEPGRLVVESRRGRARLREADGGVEYEPLDADPFGWPALPGRMTYDEALRATADTDHPDALVQIVQLFRSHRTGDLIVSAVPGTDLRERYERPEHFSSHGSLHATHMNTPLAVSAPLADGPVRTADVFATVLDFLGRDAQRGVDGRSRLAG